MAVWKKVPHILRLIVENAFRFSFNVLFVLVFQALFGSVNVLAGVAISVALTMFPVCDAGVRPSAMAGILMALFLGCGVVAQLSAVSPWLALPFDFLLVMAIMLLCGEPLQMKLYINFLLTFVFCQSMPTAGADFLVRMVGLAVGGILVTVCTLVWWRHKGYGKNGRTLREQARLGWQNRSLALRMAAGIALAMLVAALLGLKKPLWLSIVVMSLTQVEFKETIERIKHRTIGTLFGIVFFIVVFRILVPEQYSGIMILMLGYISFFTPEYKYKQIVNAVSALNASLVLLDTTTAVRNRFFCLLGGIAIVLALNLLQRALPQITGRLKKLLPGDRRPEKALPEEG